MQHEKTRLPLGGDNRACVLGIECSSVDTRDTHVRQDSQLDKDFNRTIRNADTAVRALRHYLGVTHSAITDCGGAGCTLISTTGRLWDFDPTGKPAIIQPVYFDGVIIDLVAWFPNRPNQWWLRLGEHGVALGMMRLFEAQCFGESIRLFRTPLSWLKAHGDGACLLCGDECRSLVMMNTKVVCENVAHGKAVRRIVRRGDPAAPEFLVPRMSDRSDNSQRAAT